MLHINIPMGDEYNMVNVKNIIMGIIGGVAAIMIGIAGAQYFAPEPVNVEAVQAQAFKEGVQSVVMPVIPDTQAIYQEAFAAGKASVKPMVTEVQVPVEDEVFAMTLCNRLVYDDLQTCKEEVGAEDIAINKALSLLGDEREVFDLLDDEGIIRSYKEARIVKTYSDFEDIEIVKSNFDRSSYEFKIKMKVEDTKDDVKKYVWFEVSVEDGEAEISDVSEE